MSSTKRQSSWQEDIARNFSRLFQRTKSQDPEKIEDRDIISGQENGVNSSNHSTETGEGETSLHQEDLDLSQAFQGTEEEGNRKEDEVPEETLEDRDSEAREKGGEDSRSGSYEAGGSSEEQPLSVGSLVSPLGTTAPTSPPPLDALLRRLGSLFHFKAEPARAAQQQEEQQQAERGGGGQEEAALGVVVTQPDPSGMTRGADGDQDLCDFAGRLPGDGDQDHCDFAGRLPGDGDQDHCDFAGRLPGDEDTGYTETEDRRAEKSDLHCESTSTHADQETLEKSPLGGTRTDGHGGGCGEGDQGADRVPLSDSEATLDEHQRRLALARPPVVTYGTYRSRLDRRRMRRRHQVEVDSALPEGDEVTPCTLGPAIPEQSDIQTVSANRIGSSTAETNESAVLGHTERGASHIPLTTQNAERAGRQSAFTSPQEASLATGGGQARTTVSGFGSVIGPPHAPTEHSAGAKTDTAISETHEVQQSPLNEILIQSSSGKVSHRDAGQREQTETLSEHCVQPGSPPAAAARRPSEAPGAGGTVQHTHLPAAGPDGQGGQLAGQPMSLSTSPASAAESQGPMPTTRHSDVEEELDSGPGPGPHRFESGAGGDSGPSGDPFGEALRLEAQMLVDNILMNAVAALEIIGSSELEEDGTIQKASVDTSLVLPSGQVDEEGSEEQSFKPDELVEMGPSESEEDGCTSAIPAEQTLTLNPKPLSEGPRSTPSSGYESIAGSDTDIRSSPGPACENSTHTTIVSDSCVEGTPYTGHQMQVKDPQLIYANEGCSRSNDPVNSEYSGDNHQRDGLPCFSGIVSFQKPSLCGDNEDNIYMIRVSHEHESVSGKTNDNKGQLLCSSGDKGYIDVPGVKETQVGDKELHVAKEDIESNIHSLKEDCNVNFDHVSVYNNSNDTFNQHNTNLSDITFLGNVEPDLVRRDYKHNAKGNAEADFMSVRPKQPHNSLQPSQNRYAMLHPKSIACVTLHDEDQESCPEITLKVCQTETSGLEDDGPVSLDQSFVLVKTYLASVVSEGSDSGGEETGAHCKPTGHITSESLISNSASGPSNEDRPQWSSVRASGCDVCPQQSQGTPGHSGAGAAAMAGFHQDLSSKLAGLHATGATGSRRAAAPEPPLPLLPAPLHDMETSCFSIIDEEEEADAVFVNDTGPMLSPAARRAKAYPFSLSPIVEEDGVRAEETVEGVRSQEDVGLMVPPATEEELRSLSGGVRTEQQDSSTSLSILSLLQSVSERLQSSGYSDADSEESLVPPPRCPLWDFFNRGQAENEEVDGQGTDGDQSIMEEGPGSLTVATHPFSTGPREGDPTEGSQFRNHSVSLEGQHLNSVQPVLPDHDDDTREPYAKLVPDLRDCTCPSTATDKGGYGNVISRPMLMTIYDGVTFSGERLEIHTDQTDCAMAFPKGASVRVSGGCWLLYMETGFRGPGILLEDGETVLDQQPGHQPGHQPTEITIGSIRRLVKDDRTPEIWLHPSGAQGGSMETLHSEVDNLGTQSRPIDLSNLTVKSGCWLAYDSHGFQGSYVVMEAAGSITPAAGHHQVTAVRSLRPLRMNGLRVRRPLDPKIFVFELPHFHGQSRELGGHTPSLGAVSCLRGASSLRVTGGVWVGYTGEDYTGQPYLLEEGEYRDCAQLGGAARPLLHSFRFLLADFIEPSVLLQEESVSPGPGEIEILDVDIPDLVEAGATEKTSALLVKSGVWVAYNGRGFTGEQCILEKGKHPAILPWGDRHGPAQSIRPIRSDICGTGEPKFLLRVYSLPHYRGVSKDYEGEAGHCGVASPMSFRVIRGSWLLFDEEGCCGNQYILQEGHYPDLISCGCMATSVKSLKSIPYSFSDPSISLFSMGSFEGLMMVAATSSEDMEGFFSQSLQVESGLWVVYEYRNYKGRQMLLQPGEIPVWGEHSGWDTIGSLMPLKQPRLYVMVRSRALGSVLTSESVQEDSSPARVSLSPACSLDTQRWLFIGGLLRCKASKACLSVIGWKTTAGARVALWPEHGRTHQRWSLNHNGTISSHLNHKLVLDFRGGTGFGRDHLVINEFNTDQETQFWDIDMV